MIKFLNQQHHQLTHASKKLLLTYFLVLIIIQSDNNVSHSICLAPKNIFVFFLYKNHISYFFSCCIITNKQKNYFSMTHYKKRKR